MKSQYIIATLIGLMVFWPWLLGIIDAAWWIATGQQLSSMPWKDTRGAAAFAWPFAWACAICIIGASRS